MARAKLVCGACGNELIPGVRFCPTCGAPVEAAHSTPEAPSATTVCDICGHRNTHRGAYCEACGAKLPGRSFTEAPSSHEQRKPRSRKTSSPARQSFATLQPWHYVTGAVLVILLGVFVYLELQRNTPLHTHEAPPSIPSTQAAPPQQVLDAIRRLEKTVSDNPNDNGAKLLLANALHDGAMNDPNLFPRAIAAYQHYLVAVPNDPNARVDLGICYFELGKLDTTRTAALFRQAIDEMEGVMRSHPTHQAGAFNLGIVYLYAGDIKQSSTWFKKAIELNAESDLGKRAKAILEQHAQAGL